MKADEKYQRSTSGVFGRFFEDGHIHGDLPGVRAKLVIRVAVGTPTTHVHRKFGSTATTLIADRAPCAESSSFSYRSYSCSSGSTRGTSDSGPRLAIWNTSLFDVLGPGGLVISVS